MTNRNVWRALALVAVVCGPARAEVDVSGAWFVNLQVDGLGEFPCQMQFTQSGTAVGFSAVCLPFESGAGTIDPVSGAFTITLGPSTLFCPGAIMTGTAALDGRTFEADVVCLFDVHLSGSRCGNGTVDPGETCDDGNRADGDCCSAACTPVPSGTICDPDNPCAQSACDGAGRCVATPVDGPCDDGNPCTGGDTCVDGACRTEPLPDGTACDDGDPCSATSSCQQTYCFADTYVQCDACERCDPSNGTCVSGRELFCNPVYGGGALRMQDDVVDRRDRLQLRLDEAAVAPGQFGDPRSTTAWDVCVFQEDGLGEPLAALSVPAGGSCNGRACWRPTAGGFRYRDPAGTRDGVKELRLEAGRRSHIGLRAGGLGLSLGTLPATPPLLVQLKGSNGACWQAPFDMQVNRPTEVRARAIGYLD